MPYQNPKTGYKFQKMDNNGLMETKKHPVRSAFAKYEIVNT